MQACQKCHGEYQKAWSLVHADELSQVDLLNTFKVIYHDKTPVKDVGTDPQRYMGVKYFAESLNNLKISKWMQSRVEPQVGYPVGGKIPKAWLKDVEAKFVANKPGLSNKGHNKMLLNEDGSEKYTVEDKKDIIQFLKTL